MASALATTEVIRSMIAAAALMPDFIMSHVLLFLYRLALIRLSERRARILLSQLERRSSLLASHILWSGVEKPSEHKCGSESGQRRRSENLRRGRPSEGLDPKAKHGRAGKLAE